MTIATMASTIDISAAVPNTSTRPPVPPTPPIVNQVVSGSQLQRIERVMFTWVNASGESLPSAEVSVLVKANNVVSVLPTGLYGVSYPNQPTGWNVYITTNGSKTETKQNTAVLVIPTVTPDGILQSGKAFQEPATGLIAGTALPTGAVLLPNEIVGNSNFANTPPATGLLTVSGGVKGTVNTNTGRTLTATQTFLSKFSGIS
jgi:hypothetical protein